MSKKRVAIDATATPLALTGAGYYVQELIKQLDGSDEIELFIITKKCDLDRFQAIAPNSKILNKGPNSIVGRVLFQTFQLGKFVDDLSVDLFHGPHYQVPLKMKTKSVVTIHDMTMITHPEVHKFTKRLYFTKMIPFAIKKSEAIITVSQHTADDVAKLGLANEKITVAPLGVNTSRFTANTPGVRPYKSDKTDSNLLKGRGIEGSFIAFLGLIEPRKCVPTLVRAFSKIAEDFPEHKLVIAGAEGWGIDEVRTAIAESKTSSRIVLPGRLSDDEVPALLRECDVFVYPSMYEGFGMPVIEAMACGAPVITTRSSSLSEVAGDAATLIEPKNEIELSEALSKLLSDEQLRKDFSARSIKRAKEFTWENCAKHHIDAFVNAIGSDPIRG